MKKVLLLIGILLLAGCQAVGGDYKKGTYYGSVETESYGSKYISSAVVYVGESGKIESVFIDATYFSNEIHTTKKTLQEAYGMKDTSKEIGTIDGGAEWYEQVEVLEAKIVDEQGTAWVTYNEDKSIDSLAGCTIIADDLIKAVDNALSNAKK